MADSDDLVAHMRPVLSAERDLRDLALIWQMIEASAAIGCPEEAGQILAMLAKTRARFDALQGRLIDQMVIENRAELGDDLGAKAQCAIDILVRNLYERTADVGFLATDDVVRAFCALADRAAEREAERPAMVRRLAEYQAKYTVYDDVILLSPQGELLARLDAASKLTMSTDGIVNEALSATGYVERYGATDLSGDGAPALLYGHVIKTADGRPIGVLVLRFRFADEMERIFQSIVDDPFRLVLMLVDEQQRVIATSDAAHIGPHSKLPPMADGQVLLTSFAGREYMAISCVSKGYQGYKGPRWHAVAMVSLLTAFRQRPDAGAGDDEVPLDNVDLMDVQNDADAINRELRLVLWNGSVLVDGRRRLQDDGGLSANASDSARLKAVLRQVAVTGRKTRGRVNIAIRDIGRVATARSRHQARELARLAADIMDRNLYERANDCRWWALSPVIQRVLAEPATPENERALTDVLVYINGLYTVYSQLVAFDSAGVIRAVSQADSGCAWVGQPAPAAWVQLLQSSSMPMSTSQHFAVSAFEPTALHAHGDTYVYVAAVRPASDRPVAGGVAIVFNAGRELGAMLADIIGPRNGVAAFVDTNGRVLASSDAGLSAGAVIAFKGERALIEHAGAHYACARVKAPGYREFKVSDGYDNGVSAIVALRLGPSERRHSSLADIDLVPVTNANVNHQLDAARERCVELAVFQVGPARYALPAGVVLQALPPESMVRTPSASVGGTLGMVEIAGDGNPRLVRVRCARELFGVDYPARRGDGVVVVLRPVEGSGRSPMGLRVDDVLTVLEVSPKSLHEAPRGLGRSSGLVTRLFDCDGTAADGRSTRAMLQLLSHEMLMAALTNEPGMPVSTPVSVSASAATAAAARRPDAVSPLVRA